MYLLDVSIYPCHFSSVYLNRYMLFPIDFSPLSSTSLSLFFITLYLVWSDCSTSQPNCQISSVFTLYLHHPLFNDTNIENLKTEPSFFSHKGVVYSLRAIQANQLRCVWPHHGEWVRLQSLCYQPGGPQPGAVQHNRQRLHPENRCALTAHILSVQLSYVILS